MARNHLVFSRRADAKPLTHDEIYSRAPSVFAVDKSPKLSERYGQVTTAKALGVMADFGYLPVQAAQVGNGLHAKHLIAFADPNAVEDRAELVLYNAHDGTSSLRLYTGFFRMICSNGMVAGEGFQHRLRHNASTVSHFEELIRNTAGLLPKMLDRIENMRSQSLTFGGALDYAKRAAELRWKKEVVTERTVSDMLAPRRRGDTDNSNMWGVFNHVQESLIRGGVRVGPKDRVARQLGSIQKAIDVNTGLWGIE